MYAPLVLTVMICATTILYAQGAGPRLAIAKVLDQEISGLKTLSDGERPAAIKQLANRIRQQPKEFAVALAANLAVDGVDGSGDETLLDIANTLAAALEESPSEPLLQSPAELAWSHRLPALGQLRNVVGGHPPRRVCLAGCRRTIRSSGTSL